MPEHLSILSPRFYRNLAIRTILLLVWLGGVSLLCVAVPKWAVAVEAANEATPKTEQTGLTRRVPWTTSRMTGSPLPPSPYRTEQVFESLPAFENPVVLTSAPGSDRLFLVELGGKIFSIPPQPPAQSPPPSPPSKSAEPSLFADLSAHIPGLRRTYGLAFHPQFQENRICFLCYVLAENLPEGTRVSRFRVSREDPPRLIEDSEQVLLTWRSGGHNGGCLKFGPEGYLYISSGDGGPAFPPDPLHSGQDVGNLRSSILRIDVDHTTDDRHYSIPADNPFVDSEGARGEVWAYGFRNPWKMSFDPQTGDLWVGDVGWELWEMIYRVQKGGNYGWSLKEGSQPVHLERQRGPTPVLRPTVEHSHTESRSITGGFVYRGSRLPDLQGAYVYGDYVTGKIWGLRMDGDEIVWSQELVDTPFQIICFGTDHDGELYIVAYDGTMHRLIENDALQANPDANQDFPARLTETGIFESVPDHRVASGVIPYSINADPWEDGAEAERFIALPDTSQLGVYDINNVQIGMVKGKWKFPPDAVLMKTLTLEMEAGNPDSRRRLETQILHFDQDTWRAYNYVWNDEQTDAVLATGNGTDRELRIKDPEAPGGVRLQTWHHASQTECILCHTTRAGSIHGFVPEQLQREHSYGDLIANQLQTLNAIDLFEQPVDVDQIERIADPHDASQPLDDRARSYLHVNCAHCHRRGGGGSAALDVRYDNPLRSSNLLERPTQGTFDLHSALVVAPRDPYRSVLYYRISKIGRGRMPHFGSQRIDRRGVALLHDWITTLDVSAVHGSPDLSQTGGAQTGGAQTGGAQTGGAQTGGAQTETTSSEEAYAIDRQVVQWLTSRDPQVRQQIMEPLLESTRAALMLTRLFDERRLPSEHREELLTAVEQVTEARVRDLFEPFLPEDKRIKRLGTDIRPEQILALPGDMERGRALFLHSSEAQCRNCHKIGEQGKSLGPELSKIGQKYDARQLLDTIITPSRVIDPKFLTYLVETTDGRVLSGLLLERDDQKVVLKDTQHQLITIPKDQIDLLAPQQKSLMPELLLRDLTAQQVADLVAFLRSLK